jgi:hypothetical protein
LVNLGKLSVWLGREGQKPLKMLVMKHLGKCPLERLRKKRKGNLSMDVGDVL